MRIISISIKRTIAVLFLFLMLHTMKAIGYSQFHRYSYPTPHEIIGKRIIIPTYNNGRSNIPFVYNKNSYYSGQNSNSARVMETFMGCPIVIKDIQVCNKGKKSEKFCMLFEKNDNHYSVVVPLEVKEYKKDIYLFMKLFYYDNVHHPYQNSSYKFLPNGIKIICYDYDMIEKIEKEQKGKRVKQGIGNINKGMIFNRLLFANNQNLQDWLYAEFSDDFHSIWVLVCPLGMYNEKSNGTITLNDLETIF